MKRIRTPLFYQLEARECGAVALGIILAHNGKYVSRQALRQACAVGRDGTTLIHMIRAARAYGLHPRAFQQVELSTLATLKPPFIIYWRFNHFLVVETVEKEAVWVNDPALGHRKIPADLMNDHFSGVVVTFTTTPAFVADGQPMGDWARWKRYLAWTRGDHPQRQAYRLMTHIIRLPLATFAQWYTQELTARVIHISTTQRGWYTLALALMMAVLWIGYAVLCVAWGGGIVIGLWITMVMLLIAQARIAQTVHHATYDRPQASGMMLNALAHMPSILLGGLSPDYIHRISNTHAHNITANQKTSPRLFIIQHIILFAPIWMTLIYGAVSGHIPPILRGLMAGILILGLHHLCYFATLPTWHKAQIQRLDRLAEINSLAPDVPAPVIAPPDGVMVMCADVGFAYTGSDSTQISHIQFTVKVGQMVAFVGRSGAGKSTLLAILAGAYPPQTGAVMRGAHPYWLTSSPFLVLGSLRDNLCLGDVDVSDDDLRHALADVDFPADLDMPISPAHISAGMRQQIGLARILARNPRLVLLDEATSRIDPLTERHILHALRRRGCTVVIVSHRASTFIGADTIFVLDGGRVVEHGTHRDLWDAGGAYRAVVV